MNFFVYLIASKRKGRIYSYVGYTNDLVRRLLQHNTSKGAKFTKGSNWLYLYIKKYDNKIRALKEEYKLKKTIN